MNIVDKAAFFVVAVPASALQGVDADGNGKLSLAEIDQGRAQISAQFDARFHVSSDGRRGNAAFTWILSPDDAEPETPYVVIMHRVDFAGMPGHPVISTDLFGTGPGEATLTLTATRGGTAEVAVLTPGAATHEFFRGGGATVMERVRAGVAYLRGVFDHLLTRLYSLLAAAR